VHEMPAEHTLTTQNGHWSRLQGEPSKRMGQGLSIKDEIKSEPDIRAEAVAISSSL